jgi:hypothetical protein
MKRLTPILALLVLACGGDATGPEREVPLDQEFTLALGESATVESLGLRITFAHVLEDSRCPPKAYCFWIGNVRVALDIETTVEPANLVHLCTFQDICPRAQELNGFAVELVDVDPQSMPRTALEYRATLLVRAD